ncbi:undecaprenyl/decaprenyl-phosphate alpha-N-acetylglucosaminyl 1-phosphate transferase [Alphaproteobacteria bacterium]|nr:undecaprenyl/decaprenyl-phosphate alpha-N-acetylglucosaminyl 1-phosphate transferase [Alphaproteobacteria bacterium]
MYEINLSNKLSIDLMIYAIGMLSSLIMLMIILLSKNLHQQYTSDGFLGPQKIHDVSIPRIGGLVIISSIFVQILFISGQDKRLLLAIVSCGLPVFLVGFLEDITKTIKPSIRLIITLLSGFLVTFFLDVEILKTNLEIFDKYIMVGIFPLILTIMSIVLLTQAINIIDGLDGLALGTSVTIMLSLFYLSYLYQDKMILNLTLIILSSLIFLFFTNFITGKIFLGDGGAYLIGYLSATLLIMFSSRNEEISPFAILLIVIFPIYETVRSFVRRFFSKQLKSFEPDNHHLHSIIYIFINHKINFVKKSNNKLSSCLTLVFPISTALAATFFHDNQSILIIFIFTTIFIFELLINYLNRKTKKYYPIVEA